MEAIKSKSAAKLLLTRKMPRLEEVKRTTMEQIDDLVGGTLGPGGHPVLIERPEHGLEPMITKDGVTVFQAIGFRDGAAHCLMEAVRGVARRTAAEAGDGTTTATILAAAFSAKTSEYREHHPTVSPRLICQNIQDTYAKILAPTIEMVSLPVDLETPGGRRRARAVAAVSANGDEPLADAIMECFDICGDEGNVTITESSGDSRYEVSKIQGYPLPTGYELSCAKFYPAFINDPGTQKLILDKPIFALYYGRVMDIQTLLPLMAKIQEAWEGNYLESHNVVVVATGFSEAVLGSLAHNFVSPGSINVYPVVVPQTPFANGTMHFLGDLAAVVGGDVLDPLNNRIEEATLENLGNIGKDAENVWRPMGVTRLESSRYRSTILGYSNTELLKRRAAELKSNLEFDAASDLDRDYLRERLAKLTGGIAHLKVLGSSNGELKERRDRAEDAVCAVRGALISGALIGGGQVLMLLRASLPDSEINREIVAPALLAPVQRLLSNAGLAPQDQLDIIARYEATIADPSAFEHDAFNCRTMEWVSGQDTGLFDSVPAVRQALKNSISIATLYGTLGGIIVQPRDREIEIKDSRDAAEYDRMMQENPADERP